MADFTCSICGNAFSIPEAALKKYPHWNPKYCREHSPVKKENKVKKFRANELDLTLQQVLARYSKGPKTGIFTDGGARPNPGPGGWGMVLVEEGKILEQKYDHVVATTNNRMELTALIEAYKLIPSDKKITIYSDSNLCVKSMNEWAASWAKRGWQRKSGPIKNLELVKKLYELYQAHPQVSLKWIKAHNGWLWNEYADSLATAWARDTL